MEETLIDKLNKDLKSAAIKLKPHEVRFLVDSYYLIQENRMRSNSQVREMAKIEEPHQLVGWFSENFTKLEDNLKKALDYYSASQHMGIWAREIVGIGPVISSGLMAHIDITKAPTVGHIWRYGGLDSTVRWNNRDGMLKELKDLFGNEKVNDQLVEKAARVFGRDKDTLKKNATNGKGLTLMSLATSLARRPWNASLKTLCWKIGESFVKVSGHDDDTYGKLYLSRKEYENSKNEAGDYQEQAEKALVRIGKNTDAYNYYKIGKLPPGHIHSRAKRYAVKIFLSHWFEEAYRHHYKTEPPAPFAIAILGHAHKISSPHSSRS